MRLFNRYYDWEMKKTDWGNKALLDLEACVVRIILLCVEDLPFSVGVDKVCKILQGNQTIFLTEYGLIENQMYGKLLHFSKKELIYIIKLLVLHNYLMAREELNVFEVVSVSPKGYSFLSGRRKLDIHFMDTITSVDIVPVSEDDKPFVHSLKECRIELAMQKGLQAYDICDDKTLMRIACARPTTVKQLEDVEDLDAAFIKNYGNEFVEAIWKVLRKK